MKKTKKRMIFIAIMLLIALIPTSFAFAEESSPLRVTDNPLSGEMVNITFIDANDNIVHIERLVRGQVYRLLDRYGNVCREFVARQNTIITLPELHSGDGWVPFEWRAYYRINVFNLEPLYMIEISVITPENEQLATLQALQGYRVRIYACDESLLFSDSYVAPSTIVLPEPPVPQGYAFSYWDIQIEDGHTAFVAQNMPIIYFQSDEGSLLFQEEFPRGATISIVGTEGIELRSIEVSETQTVVLQGEQWEGERINQTLYVIRPVSGLLDNVQNFQITTELIVIIAVAIFGIVIISIILHSKKKKNKKISKGK